VGRPESVGTLPEYRSRGLIRAQFDVLHQWSAERGHLVQGITGIPYYYRQFGYEMALDLGGGRSALRRTSCPQAERSEAYRFRPATEADLPFVLQVDAYSSQRLLVACIRDTALWRYEILGKSEKNLTRVEWRIVETSEGEPVGYVGHSFKLDGDGALQMPVFELKAGASWLSVTPSLLRYLKATGETYGAQQGKAFAAIYAQLGPNHPLWAPCGNRLPTVARPYAWYLRVPDLAPFLRHITPVLEGRLARSIACGATGELKLSLYRQGLRLVFAAGRLATVEAWRPRHEDPGSAAFPGLTFLQLLFRLSHSGRAPGRVRRLLGGRRRRPRPDRSTFPKQPSAVWGVT